MTTQIDLKRNKNYLLIVCLTLFLTGLTLRLINLGNLSMTEDDASLAFKALQISKMIESGTNPLPTYLGLTSFTFFILNPTNFLARFWAAIAGASIILIPCLWKDKLRSHKVIILTVIFALDPILVFYSKTIYGSIFVLAGFVWGLHFWIKEKYVLSGIAFAAAFLGGYYIWLLLIVLALTLGALYFIGKKREIYNFIRSLIQVKRKNIPAFSLSFLITSFLLATSFFLNIGGLGNLGSGFVELINIFGDIPQKPISIFIFALIAYSLLPFLLNFSTLNRFPKEEKSSWKVILGIFNLLLLMFCLFTCRGDFGLVIFLQLGLWLMAILSLEGIKAIKVGLDINTSYKVFLMVILIYLSMMIPRFIRSQVGTGEFVRFGLSSLAGLILILISFWLVSFGWTFQEAKKSFFQVLLAGLLLISIGKTLDIVFSDPMTEQLLFSNGPILMPNKESVNLVSELDRQGRIDLSESTLKLEPGFENLAWFFRFSKMFQTESDQTKIDFYITEELEIPFITNNYRGSKIVASRDIDWGAHDWFNLFLDIFDSRLVLQDTSAILWIKTELFTGVDF